MKTSSKTAVKPVVKPMPSCVVSIYDTHEKAEAAVRKLEDEGIDLQVLSIVGKDMHADDHIYGYYSLGDRLSYCGKQGAFWTDFWSKTSASAFFRIPGVGPLLIAGPLAIRLVDAIEGAVVAGGPDALGASLAGLGIPKSGVVQYESEVKNGRYLFVIHGAPSEVSTARAVLDRTAASFTHCHIADAPADMSA